MGVFFSVTSVMPGGSTTLTITGLPPNTQFALSISPSAAVDNIESNIFTSNPAGAFSQLLHVRTGTPPEEVFVSALNLQNAQAYPGTEGSFTVGGNVIIDGSIQLLQYPSAGMRTSDPAIVVGRVGNTGNTIMGYTVRCTLTNTANSQAIQQTKTVAGLAAQAAQDVSFNFAPNSLAAGNYSVQLDLFFNGLQKSTIPQTFTVTQAQAGGAAVLVSPATDNAPGSTVEIGGAGFNVGESVRIDFPNSTLPQAALVTANSSGAFDIAYVIPAGAQTGAYSCRAVGLGSGKIATTTFGITVGGGGTGGWLPDWLNLNDPLVLAGIGVVVFGAGALIYSSMQQQQRGPRTIFIRSRRR